MESATLTRLHRARSGWQRLRAVRPRTWAKIALRGDCACWRADRVLRVPDLPDLRLLLRAALGSRPAAPAPARLQGLPRSDRASAGDRLRGALLDLRPGRRAADGARLDRLVRRRSSPASTGSGGCASARSSALLAALLLLSRFFDENLAAQGYLDISYVALIVWAVVLEVERPRRGTPVFADARGRRAAAPRRVGAERRLLAVVLPGRAPSNRDAA